MTKKFLIIPLIFLAFAASYLVKARFDKNIDAVPTVPRIQGQSDALERKASGNDYNRIISLAPSITEALFELGLGEKVVGVTNFCDYPVEAQSIEKIGGYYDTSYESILMLEPDLIIMLIEHETQKKNLEGLGKRVLVVDQRDISGIMESIITIGNACGKKEQAKRTVDYINERIDHIREKTPCLPKRRVMICVGRAIGSGTLEDVYICGEKGFYNEMIKLAGGINAYRNSKIQYPTVTGEGITRLNPEVIIEIIPDLKETGLDEDAIAKEWEVLQGVDAIENHRIYIIGHDYVAIPGPRFILTLEHIARAIHPEVSWE